MRCFPDNVMVLFKAVVKEIYIVIVVGCFFIKVLTSVNVMLPPDETR